MGTAIIPSYVIRLLQEESKGQRSVSHCALLEEHQRHEHNVFVPNSLPRMGCVDLLFSTAI